MKNICSISIIILLVITFSCADKDRGTLNFTANGEDFVRKGFTSKDGWSISFDKLFINICDIKTYDINNKAKLNSKYFIDLAQGSENAKPIIIDSKKVSVGNYQRLVFSLDITNSGNYKDSSIIMIGKAKKSNKVIDFIIKLDEEVKWDCKDGYVGNEIKGIVEENGAGEVEMTFHFDHIFGDIEAGADDHINTGAVGFDYFAQFAKDNKIDVDQIILKEKTNPVQYEKLVRSIWTLGHSGEGHCGVIRTSSSF